LARKAHYKITTRSKRLDAKRRAKPPGKRRSKSGKIYYEYRSNHADKYAWERPGTKTARKIASRKKRKTRKHKRTRRRKR